MKEKCSVCGCEILPNHARICLQSGQSVCMGCEGSLKEKVLVFKLSPELTNDQNVVIEESVLDVLDAVKSFCEMALAGEHGPGEGFTVTIGELPRYEIMRLPEI